MASSSPCAIVLLGNSGVGKSFLANRILDDDQAFESKFSVRSVTRQTEWKKYVTANGSTKYLVGNIPGLIEGNQKLIDENRIEIMKAFEQYPWAIVLFIFGHKNGRIPDEDIVAFTRINNAYEFPSKSLLIIVNGIPSNRPDIYEEKTRQLLHELIHVDDNHICFIEKITADKDKMIIHRQLHEAIAKCEPAKHIKKHDIELLVDEISRLKLESHQLQNQLLTQEQNYLHRQTSESTSDVYQELHQPQIRTNEQTSRFIETSKPIDKSTKPTRANNNLFTTEYNRQQHKSVHDGVIQSGQQLINNSQQMISDLRCIEVLPQQPIHTSKKSRSHTPQRKEDSRKDTCYFHTEIVNPSNPEYPYTGYNSSNVSYQNVTHTYDHSNPNVQDEHYQIFMYGTINRRSYN